MKTCSKCKQTKPLDGFGTHKGKKDGRQSQCKACNKAYITTENYKATLKKYQKTTWKGMASQLINRMRTNSRKRGHEWNNEWWTIEKIRDCIENQHCSVTGIKFDLTDTRQKDHKRPFVPSPDRIDNLKGYEPSNVQWVVFIYNLMKNSFDDKDVAHFLQSLKNLEDIKDFKETL
jgi:superfamily II DNA helicase RecQ